MSQSLSPQLPRTARRFRIAKRPKSFSFVTDAIRTPLFAVAVLAFSGAAFAATAQAADVAKIFAAHATSGGETVDHGAWDKLLKTYVKPDSNGLNRVDYAKFKASGHDALKAYLATLSKVDPAKLGKNEQFAFWANLYNAKTVEIVLSKYPVKSIKKISLGGSFFASLTGGPWKAKVLKVKGTKLSLDDIEHGILRPVFKDPRVHYAVNCASVGCPNLGTEAFTGAKLEEQLNKGAATYINSPRGFKVNGNRITASSIYKWFRKDFGGSEAGVLKHAAKYAAPALKSKLQSTGSIYSYDYDWNLNDVK